MSPKMKALAVGVGVVLLVVSYLAGKYSNPAKVVEVTKTVEVKVIDEKLTQQMIENAKKEWEASLHKDIIRSTRIEYSESGKPKSKVTDTKIIIDKIESSKAEDAKLTVTIAEKKEATEKSVEIKKETTYERPGWRVAALAGVALDRPGQLIYDGSVSRRLWGTLWWELNVSVDPNAPDRDIPQKKHTEVRVLTGPALEF